jgi:hypothetical protein
VVNELIATGAINYEATLAAIAATLPLNSVGLAVAQSYSALGAGTTSESNGCLKHAIAVVELKSVAVPAVAVRVGELIANLALVGILASRSLELSAYPNAGVLTVESANANHVDLAILQSVEVVDRLAYSAYSGPLLGSLSLVLKLP